MGYLYYILPESLMVHAVLKLAIAMVKLPIAPSASAYLRWSLSNGGGWKR